MSSRFRVREPDGNVNEAAAGENPGSLIYSSLPDQSDEDLSPHHQTLPSADDASICSRKLTKQKKENRQNILMTHKGERRHWIAELEVPIPVLTRE